MISADGRVRQEVRQCQQGAAAGVYLEINILMSFNDSYICELLYHAWSPNTDSLNPDDHVFVLVHRHARTIQNIQHVYQIYP
jgi:hypothetical protein